MSDLSPEAAALLRAGRNAFRPNAGDRERVLRSLSATFADRADLESARRWGRGRTSGVPGTASWRLWHGWVVGGLAIVAVGTGVVAMRQGSRTSMRPIATAPAPVEAGSVRQPLVSTSAPADGLGVIGPQAPADHSPTSIRQAARTATRLSRDSLAEEVRLLSRAEQQMNEGLAEEALKTLADHERRFPAGALWEERMAARIQALCALGRTSEARSDLVRLGRAYPRSPQLARARRICGVDVAGP